MPTDDEPNPVNKPSAESHPILPLGSWMWRQARKVVVAVIGTTVLLIGIVMMVAPGPGTIVIPAGLAILATEFVWAKRLLRYAKQRLNELTKTTPFSIPPTHDVSARPIVPPIVIDDHGDVSVFSSVETAAGWMEPVDVRNDEYVVYDSEGYILRLNAGEQRVSILGRVSEEPTAMALVQVLRSYIERASAEKIPVEVASLSQLLTLCIQRFGYAT